MSRLAHTGSHAADTLRQFLVVLGTLITLVVNGLANALPINSQTTAQVSDRFPVFFVPAGYVFSIWGVIYLGLIAYTIYQALPARREDPLLRRTGWLYILTCAANSAWIFLWHYELFAMTLLVMLSLLALLVAIYVRLDPTRATASTVDRLFVYVPFSIYLAWITVATVANATDFLHSLNWDGSGISPQLWAAIMLLVATGIAAFVTIPRRDFAYMAVIIWAFAGIVVKQADAPLVAVTAGLTAAAVTLALLSLLFLRTRPRLPAASS